MVTFLLARSGIVVRCAADGIEALAMVSRETFDVCLLDVVMPGMRGEQVLDNLKVLQPDLPVIMMSGIMDDTMVRALTARGAWKAVAKQQALPKLAQLCREASEAAQGTRIA
jgi:DNA-binding NtrC family response regulator